MRFIPCTARGALPAISSASARAATSASEDEATRSTSPMASAFAASTGLPVKNISRAWAGPTSARKRRIPAAA